MPITNTLEVSRRLTQAGFPGPQAEVLSDLLEGTAQDAVREIKIVVAQEGERIRAELRAEMRALAAENRAEFREELRKQMLWFFAMQAVLIGAAVALFKLLS